MGIHRSRIFFDFICRKLSLLLEYLNLYIFDNSSVVGECGCYLEWMICKLVSRIASWCFPMKLPQGECQTTPLITSSRNGFVTWDNETTSHYLYIVHQLLWHRTTSLVHNELSIVARQPWHNILEQKNTILWDEIITVLIVITSISIKQILFIRFEWPFVNRHPPHTHTHTTPPPTPTTCQPIRCQIWKSVLINMDVHMGIS